MTRKSTPETQFMVYLTEAMLHFRVWLDGATRDTLIVGQQGFENLVDAVEQEIDRRIKRGEWD